MSWTARATALLTATGCGQEVLLAAELEGQLLRGEVPAADVTVERTIHLAWSGDVWTQNARSDTEGRFRFEALSTTLWLGAILPHEPGIRQTLTADGEEFFDGTKRSYDTDGLLGSRLVMRCRLDREPDATSSGLFWSNCEAVGEQTPQDK